jgi:hypothetical protein
MSKRTGAYVDVRQVLAEIAQRMETIEAKLGIHRGA